MLLALPEEQILCLARNIQAMFSSLNFQETWFANSWVHQVTETVSYLLEDSADSFHTAQTGAEAVYMIECCTEVAREWNIPECIAKPDLKKAFDRFSHDSIAEMLCRKNLCPQLVAVLCSWWCCSSLEVRLGHVTSDRCISVYRGGAQSKASF